MNEGFEGALKIALEMLRASDRFRVEIERRLVQKGHSWAVIRLVFDWLDSKRLLDDRRVAEEAVRQMSAAKGMGKELIRSRLIARSGQEELADQVLSGISEEDQLQAARRFLSKKIRPSSTRNSMLRALCSKGFSEGVALAAVGGQFGEDIDPDVAD